MLLEVIRFLLNTFVGSHSTPFEISSQGCEKSEISRFREDNVLGDKSSMEETRSDGINESVICNRWTTMEAIEHATAVTGYTGYTNGPRRSNTTGLTIPSLKPNFQLQIPDVSLIEEPNPAVNQPEAAKPIQIDQQTRTEIRQAPISYCDIVRLDALEHLAAEDLLTFDTDHSTRNCSIGRRFDVDSQKDYTPKSSPSLHPALTRSAVLLSDCLASPCGEPFSESPSMEPSFDFEEGVLAHPVEEMNSDPQIANSVFTKSNVVSARRGCSQLPLGARIRSAYSRTGEECTETGYRPPGIPKDHP